MFLDTKRAIRNQSIFFPYPILRGEVLTSDCLILYYLIINSFSLRILLIPHHMSVTTLCIKILVAAEEQTYPCRSALRLLILQYWRGHMWHLITLAPHTCMI